MYTDGITESRNASDEEFGEDRLIDLALQSSQHAAALAESVIAAATQFSNGNFNDDLTVVAITVDDGKDA
jgi:serine phosphatase RsbU (regulator of sigma subunit)